MKVNKTLENLVKNKIIKSYHFFPQQLSIVFENNQKVIFEINTQYNVPPYITVESNTEKFIIDLPDVHNPGEYHSVGEKFDTEEQAVNFLHKTWGLSGDVAKSFIKKIWVRL